MAAVSRSAYGRAAATRCWALRMRDVAMSSMARVIFMVDWTDRIRRLTVRSFAPICPRPLFRGFSPAVRSSPAELAGQLDLALPDRPGLLPDLLRRGPPELLDGFLLLVGERVGRGLLERRVAFGRLEDPSELHDGLLQPFRLVVGKGPFGPDVLTDLGMARFHEEQEFVLEALHVLHRCVVQEAVGDGEDGHDLLLDGHGLALPLLEDLPDSV